MSSLQVLACMHIYCVCVACIAVTGLQHRVVNVSIFHFCWKKNALIEWYKEVKQT